MSEPRAEYATTPGSRPAQVLRCPGCDEAWGIVDHEALRPFNILIKFCQGELIMLCRGCLRRVYWTPPIPRQESVIQRANRELDQLQSEVKSGEVRPPAPASTTQSPPPGK